MGKDHNGFKRITAGVAEAVNGVRRHDIYFSPAYAMRSPVHGRRPGVASSEVDDDGVLRMKVPCFGGVAAGGIPLPGNGDTWIVDQDPSVARASGWKRLRRGEPKVLAGTFFSSIKTASTRRLPRFSNPCATGGLPDGFCRWRRGLLGLRSGRPGHDPRQLARAFARLALRRLSGPGAGRSPIPIHTVVRGIRCEYWAATGPWDSRSTPRTPISGDKSANRSAHGRLLHVANRSNPKCLAQPASILTRRHLRENGNSQEHKETAAGTAASVKLDPHKG